MVNIDKGRHKVSSRVFHSFVPFNFIISNIRPNNFVYCKSIYQFIYWPSNILIMTLYDSNNRYFGKAVISPMLCRNSASSSIIGGTSITLNDFQWRLSEASAIDNLNQYIPSVYNKNFHILHKLSIESKKQKRKSKINKERKNMICFEEKSKKRRTQ